MTMQTKLLYWLMGDRAARVIIATWNWLWGIPVTSGGKVAVEVAQESLQSMQQSVVQLAEAVSQVMAAHRQAKDKYEAKQREFELLEKQALLAHKTGSVEAARMAMTQVMALEQLLPQLAERVSHAEQMMNAAKDKLGRERTKLETYKMQMQNLKALSEVNEALAVIAKVNTDLNIDSARSQFETAESSVQHRYHQVESFATLSENPAEKLTAELDQLTLEDRINQRLKQLEESTLN
jgi:phage shock protein A